MECSNRDRNQVEAKEKCINEVQPLFTIGSMHPVYPRLKLPQNTCIMWRKNKFSLQDTRLWRPFIVELDKTGQETETLEDMCAAMRDKRWIPVRIDYVAKKYLLPLKPPGRPY